MVCFRAALIALQIVVLSISLAFADDEESALRIRAGALNERLVGLRIGYERLKQERQETVEGLKAGHSNQKFHKVAEKFGASAVFLHMCDQIIFELGPAIEKLEKTKPAIVITAKKNLSVGESWDAALKKKKENSWEKALPNVGDNVALNHFENELSPLEEKLEKGRQALSDYRQKTFAGGEDFKEGSCKVEAVSLGILGGAAAGAVAGFGAAGTLALSGTYGVVATKATPETKTKLVTPLSETSAIVIGIEEDSQMAKAGDNPTSGAEVGYDQAKVSAGKPYFLPDDPKKKAQKKSDENAFTFEIPDDFEDVAVFDPKTKSKMIPQGEAKVRTEAELIAEAQSQLKRAKEGKPTTLNFATFSLETETADQKPKPSELAYRRMLQDWKKKEKEYQALVANTKGGWDKKVEALMTKLNKDFLFNYRRSNARIADLLAGRGGNCEAETKMIFAAMQATGLIPTGDNLLAAQVFDDHVQAVIYNSKTKVTWSLLTGKKIDGLIAPVFKPEILIKGYLDEKGKSSPVTNKELMLANVPEELKVKIAGSGGGNKSNSILKLPKTGFRFRQNEVPVASVIAPPQTGQTPVSALQAAQPGIGNQSSSTGSPQNQSQNNLIPGVIASTLDEHGSAKIIFKGSFDVIPTRLIYNVPGGTGSEILIFKRTEDKNHFLSLKTKQERDDFIQSLLKEQLEALAATPTFAAALELARDPSLLKRKNYSDKEIEDIKDTYRIFALAAFDSPKSFSLKLLHDSPVVKEWSNLVQKRLGLNESWISKGSKKYWNQNLDYMSGLSFSQKKAFLEMMEAMDVGARNASVAITDYNPSTWRYRLNIFVSDPENVSFVIDQKPKPPEKKDTASAKPGVLPSVGKSNGTKKHSDNEPSDISLVETEAPHIAGTPAETSKPKQQPKDEKDEAQKKISIEEYAHIFSITDSGGSLGKLEARVWSDPKLLRSLTTLATQKKLSKEYAKAFIAEVYRTVTAMTALPKDCLHPAPKEGETVSQPVAELILAILKNYPHEAVASDELIDRYGSVQKYIQALEQSFKDPFLDGELLPESP